MSLIFVGIIPNRKELILEEEKLELKGQTINGAVRDLVGELYCLRPDSILIVSNYGNTSAGVFNINISDKLFPSSTEENFYSHQVNHFYRNDLLFISGIKEAAEKTPQSFAIVCNAETVIPKKINYAIATLFKPLVNTKLALVGLPDVPLIKILKAGIFFYQEIIKINKRIAVIGIGEFNEDDYHNRSLSHLCISILKQKEIKRLGNINDSLTRNCASDLLRPLAFIAGMLEKNNFSPVIKCDCRSKNKRSLVINFELN